MRREVWLALHMFEVSLRGGVCCCPLIETEISGDFRVEGISQPGSNKWQDKFRLAIDIPS